MTDHTTPRGPLGILGDRLAGDAGQLAAINAAEVLECLGDLESNIEILGSQIDSHARAFVALAMKLDGPDEDKGLVHLLFHVGAVLEALDRDTAEILSNLHAIRATGKAPARPVRRREAGGGAALLRRWIAAFRASAATDADAADELRYDLGYAIAEQGGTGPAAAAGRALVATASFAPGEEWTTLPALAFAETMRQALPELPADLAAAVETVLSEPTADAGFSRLAQSTIAGLARKPTVEPSDAASAIA